MSNNRLIVLKFGGSVLQRQQDVHRVAQEIYRWRRNGYLVIAVVSAIGNTTNRLSCLAQDFGDQVDPQKTAALLATGELRSAALIGLALDRAGISSFVCDDTSIGLRTSGPVLDATLDDVDTCFVRRKLDQRGVIVVPGFIGRGEANELTLLGRGGSDLTALFIATRLNAARCRLVKDVDGLYEYDPRLADDGLYPRRFKFVSFNDALTLDESIVQHKAVRFARDHDMPFEVARVSSAYATKVGRFSCSTFAESAAEHVRLRIALVGLGTVGLGVYQQVQELFEDELEIVSVAVADRQKAVSKGVPEALIADSAEAAIESDCDVVVELVGGEELPYRWIVSALQQGKHVVTANKALLALHANRLEKLALENGVAISWSAAVGGSVPVLETVRRLSQTDEVVEIAGILNGSTNYIVDEIASGVSFDDAVARAVELGLTEQDPMRDLAGIDAAEKLVLIARECGVDLSVANIHRQELTAERVDQAGGRSVRQVARLKIHQGKANAQVSISKVRPESSLAQARGSGNVVEILSQNGGRSVIHGLGAGRWPTTAAVIADLVDLFLLAGKQKDNYKDNATQGIGQLMKI